MKEWGYKWGTTMNKETQLSYIFLNCKKGVMTLSHKYSNHLKAVDTIGNCQRLAFTVCVYQHMHKITNL